MTQRELPLRVLHLGALDSIHLRRWVEMSEELGHDVMVGGHLRPGFTSAFPSSPKPLRAPQVRWASTRRAERTRRPAHRLLAALPNWALEVPIAAAWVRRLVRRVRPDVIHTHWLPHWGAAAALAGGAPLVAGAMGSDVYDPRRGERRLTRLALRRADLALAPSPHMQAVLAPYAPGRAVHLDQGVDLGAFRPPSPAEREEARARLGAGPGPVVLSFRTAAEIYGLPLVARAFRELQARRPDAHLLMVHGSAPLDPATARLLSGMNGSVTVVGEATPEKMRTCFHAADVGVSVPITDGSPVSVWESLACGTPVVCSALPQLRERLRPGDGVVFASRDPGSVAGALEHVVADPGRGRTLAAAGRRWTEANVDRQESLRRIDAIYRSVSGRS